jgi:hypothetical protein
MYAAAVNKWPWRIRLPIVPGRVYSFLMEFTYLENEEIIGTWTINYLPPGGGRYTGYLAVTDLRILYDAKFDTSFTGVIGEAYFVKHGSEGYISIPKDKIDTVAVKKKALSKSVVVTLTDGSIHTFHYGAMNVDKIAEAIKV